jgi:DNA-binding MarR family transcriptional regulator
MSRDLALASSHGTGASASPTMEECLEMGRACACSNLRRAARAVTQVFDAYFEEHGLKATQFTVLAVLSYSRDEAHTVTSLADALVLEQSSLSRNLAVLERLGHVKLVMGEDRRSRIVTLTRTGRSALTRAYPAWKRAQAAVAGSLPPSELDAQLRALRRLTDSALAVRPPSRTVSHLARRSRKRASA